MGEGQPFDISATCIGTITNGAEHELARAALGDAVEAGTRAFLFGVPHHFELGAEVQREEGRLRFCAMRLAMITRPREEM